MALVHRDAQTTEAVHLFVVELEALSAAAEWGQPPNAPEPAHRPWWKRALSIGKTATDSLAEVLEKHFSPGAKAIWEALSELGEIICGD